MFEVASASRWAEYPVNLIGTDSAIDGYDCETYQDQLRQESKRLFVDDGSVCIRVIELGSREIDIENVEDLEIYLEESKGVGVTRLFLIPQQSSWGSLVISYEAIRKLLSFYTIHPAFIDVLRAFGQRTGSQGETYAGLLMQSHLKSNFDISYLVKHAEENQREGAPSPWSIRQMGVHHKRRPGASDVLIIVNPSTALQQRLRRLIEPAHRVSQSLVHVMVQSSSTTQWRWYISWLERQYLSMKTKAQISNVLDNGERLSAKTDIHFDDTQDIQVLQDLFLQAHYFLGTNQFVQQKLLSTPLFARVVEDDEEDVNSRSIACLGTEADVQSLRVTNILRRVDATLALVRAILDFRSLASVQSSSKSNAEMAMHSRKDTELMKQLAQKAGRDTDILKTVTLLGLVYLPAGFVASMMSMGYIHVHNNGHVSIAVSGEFWVFLMLTAILLCITLLSYYIWLRRRRIREREDPCLAYSKEEIAD